MAEKKHKYLIDQISMEWLEFIFSDLEDDMGLEEFVAIAEDQGVHFGKRRDVFNRLIDLRLLEKYTEDRIVFLRWTSFGEQLKQYFSKSQSKMPYVLHLLQITETFNNEAKRYFSTYFFITDILMASKNKLSAAESYEELFSRLSEKFPDGDVTGIEKTAVGKAKVFLNEILDEDYNELQFVDPILMAFGIQRYIEMKTGDDASMLLITEKERKELATILLIQPSQFEQHLEKVIKYSKAFEVRYSTAGIILNPLKKIEL